MDALSPGFKGRGKCPMCGNDESSFSVGKQGRLTSTCTVCQAQVFARAAKSHGLLRAFLTDPPAAPGPAQSPKVAAPTAAPAAAAAPAPAPKPRGFGFFNLGGG